MMVGVVELIDRAVALSPGPALSAALAGLAWDQIPNARLVEVLQARSRQLAHDQALLFAGLAEIARAVPISELPAADRAVAVARAADDFEWAAHEIAAGLTWTPTAAERELSFGQVLVRELPLVFAALERGEIDRGKAKVFVDHLDPSRGELTPAQIRRLCERFVPLAPGWTTQQLSRRLLRAIVAIDPGFHRRRYRRGVQERGVVLHLDRNGTATLSGEGLPPDEAAAASARLDRLAEAARRAGHPGRLSQINADLYVGMLNGSFHGLTEAEILAHLLAHPRSEDGPDADTADVGTGAPENRSADPAPDAAAADEKRIASIARRAADGPAGPMPGAAGDRWHGERVGVREGVEIRVGLATLSGCDERPGEIPGLGPVDAEVARRIVAAQRRGAEWEFAIVDSDGYLLLSGPLRRRPRHSDQQGAGPRGPVRGGVVEVHLTVAELRRFGRYPDMLGGWAGVLAEIADRWAERHRMWRRLSRDPRARFARGALARHVRIRDRTCVGPGCTRSARRSDLDHTRDHAWGGDTVEANIGPGCWRHHPDKERGWMLTQPEPGLFVWRSPLGRTYRTRGEPVRPDLPDPDPPVEGLDDREDPDIATGSPVDLRILWRPARDSARPPPASPDEDEGEPPF
jgi:uncharacterized protein DUF222